MKILSEHFGGVVFICETWAYYMKENDHTAFQLLDGEMKVSDLNSEDKREALMVRMENGDGDCLVYLDEIVKIKMLLVSKIKKIRLHDAMKCF